MVLKKIVTLVLIVVKNEHTRNGGEFHLVEAFGTAPKQNLIF